MTQVDRRTGLVGNTGIKEPVKTTTTANITLSGEQTIDGISCVDGDRVLVKDQTTAANNGIYEVDTGTWSRTKDCDGAYDLKNGTLIFVRQGTTNGNKIFKCSATEPITIGTTSLSFTIVDIEFSGNVQTVWCGTAGGTTDALTLTPSNAVTALTSGLTLLFKSGAANNTTAVTIAVSGLTATTAQLNGAAMVAGDIEANRWYMAVYEAGGTFQVSKIGIPALLHALTIDGAVTASGAWIHSGTVDFTGAVKANGTALAGTLPLGNAAGTTIQAWAPRGIISGLTLSNNGTDAVNDVDIAVGEATDSTAVILMRLTSALTKRLDAAWAAGTNQGMLDGTESVAGTPDVSTWYHIYLIRKDSDGTVDVLASESATAPTMPAGYTYKRRIGAVYNGSAGDIRAFTQRGDNFRWAAVSNDVSLANDPGTAAVSRTLLTPLGVVCRAVCAFALYQTDANTNHGLLSELTSTDEVPAAATQNVGTSVNSSGNTQEPLSVVELHTNTSSQVRTRVSYSSAATYVNINTFGYYDYRGRHD